MAVKVKNHKACGKKLLIGVGALIVLGIIKSVLKEGNTTTMTANRSILATSPTPSAVVTSAEVVSANINIKLLEGTAPDCADRDAVKVYLKGLWVVDKLSIQKNKEDAINVNTLNFKMADKDSGEFTISNGGTIGMEMTANKTLSFRTINSSNMVEGYLAYDISKSYIGLPMEASENIAGSPIILKIN